MKYVSNTGGGQPVDFETAILDGYASDGGLYVPEVLPKLSHHQLESWKDLSYQELAFKIVSLFVDRSIISEDELRSLITVAYETFESEEVIPIYQFKSEKDLYIMELFYGPTLSFKDIGQSFLVNLYHFFLERKGEHRTIIVATTGDTGPAAANFIAGKATMDAWVLYPEGMITEEQKRQMTTLPQTNVHPVGVHHCPEGGDDLDAAIHQMYANKSFKEKVKLSSVNSINWGRIMVQMVHYFYGYLQIAEKIGEEIVMAVPSGGFGNLCAGGLAMKMGLPIKCIIANNKNDSLHRIFSRGIVSKAPIYETISSAIDILIPYNFWRYLYFCVDGDADNIRRWKKEFEEKGEFQFDDKTYQQYHQGFYSIKISDKKTLDTIKNTYQEEGYLLDPHAAVAVTAIHSLKKKIGDRKAICLATAHPAKFPKTIKKSLKVVELPEGGKHRSIEKARKLCQKGYTCDQSHLYEALSQAIESHWTQTRGSSI